MERSDTDTRRTILTTYLPSTYIPSDRDARFHRSDPPIRAISPSGSDKAFAVAHSLGEWASPNYLTGIAAAIFSLVSVRSVHNLSFVGLDQRPRARISYSAVSNAQAAHPSPPHLSLGQLSTLLLPLPLSSLSNSAYRSALEAASPALASASAAPAAGVKTRWDEVDDEPYVAPGMGGRQKRDTGGAKDRDEVGGMYM
jgi:hypothetical protein